MPSCFLLTSIKKYNHRTNEYMNMRHHLLPQANIAFTALGRNVGRQQTLQAKNEVFIQ